MSERTAEYGVVRRRESPRNIKTSLLLCCASWIAAAASLLLPMPGSPMTAMVRQPRSWRARAWRIESRSSWRPTSGVR